MKRARTYAMAMFAFLAVWQSTADNGYATMPLGIELAASGKSVQQDLAVERMGSTPMAFTENRGQWDERVKFRANAGAAAIWFTSDGIYYQFTRRISKTKERQPDRACMLPDRPWREPGSTEQLVIKATFVGANRNVEFIGEGLMGHKCNYFIGNDPEKWHTDVPNFETVTMHNIYEGVDLRFYGRGDGILMYQYMIAPGVKADQVMIEYDGLVEMSQDETGSMVTHTPWGDIKGILASPGRSLPVSGGGRFSSMLLPPREVEENRVELQGTRSVQLVFSTFLGGQQIDGSQSIAVDDSGCAYVTGYTTSTDFPTFDPYQSEPAGSDEIFVTKLDATGGNLVYSTYLGGSSDDICRSIAVDSSGCAYLTGDTPSDDFPIVNAYDASFNGFYDAFVTKLDQGGASLVYSTYVGGTSAEGGFGIALDADGNAYVAGTTLSTNFPTVNPYQTNQNGEDAFVMRLNAAGDDLVYSTYLGGYGVDRGQSIAVDTFGSAYVAGHTTSLDFPLINPFQADQGGSDAFVTKLSPAGNDLLYSTYLGGSLSEDAYDIDIDSDGYAYVAGYTSSSDFPTVNPIQTQQGDHDAFVAKLDTNGANLIYSTYLGGTEDDDEAFSIKVDAEKRALVTGYTSSTDFPTANPLHADPGDDNWDAFVAKLSHGGNRLVYSTYLGGSSAEMGMAIATGAEGSVYVTGYTWSADFPTLNPYQTYQAGQDIFVTKLGFSYVCGDADGSSAVDIDDVVYLIAFIFSGGPEPIPYESGDADCSGAVDIDDVVYLIAFIFSGGPEPCDPNSDGVPDC